MDKRTLSRVPNSRLSRCDLSLLKPGETIVVEATTRVEDRAVEITVTITTFARKETIPLFDNDPVGELATVMRFANVSITNVFNDEHPEARDPGEEFGVLSPESCLAEDQEWQMVTDGSVVPFAVKTITIFI